MEIWQLVYLPLIALLTWAAFTDVRERRIPNWLSFSLMLTGLALAMQAWTGLTLKQSSLGLFEGLSIGIVLMVLGVWSAGDAKLLAGIGAWIGPVPLLMVLAASALVSLVIAISVSVARGQFLILLRNGMSFGVALATAGRVRISQRAPIRGPAIRGLPLAVPLLVATLAVLGMAAAKGW